MSDEEIICTWMEPSKAHGRWWSYGKRRTESEELVYFPDHSEPIPKMTQIFDVMVPTTLTLDLLHEVEARLTEEQWWKYCRIVLGNDIESTPRIMIFQKLLHADAPTRIKALASVLRKEVEG